MTSTKTPARKRRAAPQQQDTVARARLPHERDESVDSQEPSASQREVGQQAHDDVESEQVDTGSAPVTDRTYRRLK